MCTALSFRVMCMLRTLMQCLPEWSPVPLFSGDNLLEYLWVYEINRGPPATWMNLLCPNFLSSKGQLNGDLMEHIFGAGPRSINSFLSRNQWAKTEFRFGFYGHGLVFLDAYQWLFTDKQDSQSRCLQKHRRVLHVLFPFIGVFMALWMEWLPLTKCQARVLCFSTVMYFWWSGQDFTADWA